MPLLLISVTANLIAASISSVVSDPKPACRNSGISVGSSSPSVYLTPLLLADLSVHFAFRSFFYVFSSTSGATRWICSLRSKPMAFSSAVVVSVEFEA